MISEQSPIHRGSTTGQILLSHGQGFFLWSPENLSFLWDPPNFALKICKKMPSAHWLLIHSYSQGHLRVFWPLLPPFFSSLGSICSRRIWKDTTQLPRLRLTTPIQEHLDKDQTIESVLSMFSNLRASLSTFFFMKYPEDFLHNANEVSVFESLSFVFLPWLWVLRCFFCNTRNKAQPQTSTLH